MKVLVAAASKHGATQQIAEAIGEELTARELDVTVAPRRRRHVDHRVRRRHRRQRHLPREVDGTRQAVRDRSRSRARVAPRLGIPQRADPRPESKADYSLDRREGDEIANAIRAREHRLFFGKLDRKRLSLLGRGPVRMAKLPDGDFRPWDEIKTWAAGIADALQAVTAR
jgi:menaquinone-dependent protoporphyrinogen oxidase